MESLLVLPPRSSASNNNFGSITTDPSSSTAALITDHESLPLLCHLYVHRVLRGRPLFRLVGHDHGVRHLPLLPLGVHADGVLTCALAL